MKLLEKNIRSSFFSCCAAGLLFALSGAAPVAAADSDVAQRLFEQAIEKRDSGDVFAAIEIFETILASNPKLNRARLELAVAYHQASRYQAALRELNTVLDDPDTPENVRLSILAYLGQVANDEKQPEGKHYLSYFIKAGVLNNSNLNASQAIITGQNTSSDAPLSSPGSDLVFNVAHRYSKKRLLNLAGNTTAFEWQSQATLSSNAYSRNNDYNLHIASLSTGPAFITPGRWRASALLQADYIMLGSDQLATFVSFNPTIRFDLGRYRTLALESSYTTHDYRDASNAGYNGDELMLGIGYAMYLPQAASGIEFGLRDRSNDADDDAFSYDFNEFYAAGFTSLNDNTNLYLRLHRRGYEYAAVDPLVGLVRDETENYIALGFNYDHPDGWLKGWTLNAEISSVSSDSNADSLDYRRTLLSLNWSRYFQ